MDRDSEATDQEKRLHRMVQEAAMVYWANKQAPPYVPQLVCLECVKTVLRGTRCVLKELGMRKESLDGVDPAELAYFWDELLRELDADGSPWDPVSIGDSTVLLMKRIAASLHAMFWQRLRYSHFLINGAPPGVQQLPAYSEGVAQRSFALNNGWWQLPGKSWTHYVSCSATIPNRKSSLRASACTVSDLVDPRAFA